MAQTYTPEGRGLGYIPDLPDARDLHFGAVLEPKDLPPQATLRDKFPTPYNQQQLGSCTANAIAGAVEYEQIKQGLDHFTPSRLMIYYDERAMEGTIASDAGAAIRDGIKSVATQGACHESMWPYSIDLFKMKPTDACYTEAIQYKALTYQRVNLDLLSLRSSIAQGYPVVIGISLYESFESAATEKSGVIPMPDPSKEKLLGGHAMLVVGYDDASARFVVRNSWGASWGDGGYCTIPYAYLTNQQLGSDYWMITLVDSPPDPAPGPPPTPPTPTPTATDVALNLLWRHRESYYGKSLNIYTQDAGAKPVLRWQATPATATPKEDAHA